MKKLILGIALASLAIGCKSNDNNQVSDASGAELPATCESCEDGGSGGSCCSDAAAAETECGSGGTCPATGAIDG